MAKLFVSNKDESVQIFENPVLEKFTFVHPITPVALFGPVVLFFLGRAFVLSQVSAPGIAGLFLAGLAFWTLFEYILHRWIFHYEPKSVWGQRLHFIFHGNHHDYPSDTRRLVMPPIVSISLAAVTYFGMRSLLGTMIDPFFAGFVLGYICYDTIHYASHHMAMKGPIGRIVKKHHLKHHFKSPEQGYGVSSPIWDYVFRTGFKDND